MAIFRLELRIISRRPKKQGLKGLVVSVVEAAAYCAGVRIEDWYTKEIHDFSTRQDILYRKIIAPEGSPDWVFDREQLWNQVEHAERRRDAQLARRIDLALPAELELAKQKALLCNFVQEIFVDPGGVVVDISIAAPSQDADPRNFHAYVLIPTRKLVNGLWSPKLGRQTFNNPEFLRQLRSQWAVYVNEALKDAGLEISVDHRSNRDRGIEPQQTRESE